MEISSRVPGFYKMTVEERKKYIIDLCQLEDEDAAQLMNEVSLPIETADKMIENVIGTFSLPFGLGLNFMIDEKEYMIPMAVEEPSIVASASYIAKIVREAGGFKTEATERIMIGQIQVVGCPDFQEAKEAILREKEMLIQAANDAYPSLVARGGGAGDLEVRLLNEEASKFNQMLVIHLYVNTCDAMGANIINTMAESLAPVVEHLTDGKVYLRILSNYADRCLAKATCTIPPYLLESDGFSGEEVRDGVVHAYEFAASDPYRAVTHNKGIMNGIDPVIIATGNDWRAVEAGAHAYAARDGQYSSMTTWSVDGKGNLVGELELPMSLGIVGGASRVHPMAKVAYKLLRVESARELAQVIVSVGLAQNLGALKALVTDGIQKGHMALHSRSVAMAAGATGELIDIIAEKLVEAKEIRVGYAKKLMEEYAK
ncbi:hydroxymethylglutaryl-CoA reductase, degradative [Pseudogracilibacillus auburnensis]|uniref:3-hydroxy-3-methylglutaryl coenzyme A reductase n=1 Tax=Pseudogracilibacillus auburnensis TaxID=1494959 RepID=A0A2V3VUQ7_9BACI|nr:hydroxymethylglutaryl-CoA reductase, degradative [Pseudogracilibacillus auburnensis]MBO1004037.1 hydroxymethylglutaryl-CoA reductase, degradative [Pseudogracilibacillus auburnensis]PXW85673.1 3-hydroxy-3-methylglutaryl-coenzyme A reductase [Pseudogracilibacillus auburnensis]